ncbi:GNAT family N-acetyltransferase [Xanthomarina sp. F1114]|uniref:GNAT family N-acetyltransferase n=1 Tax=Xanthomarina sp. F1114 TaxID=2996019 RepID=UPI00225E0A5C|nr:GNAT family N-acetyltransferase [Xanthomarina sp. F1114]MCX7548013.1 GNAT family N-acetyltransferase [Xanthomarina sp. F1114]
MTTINKADIDNARCLSILGKQTFLESHGMSAPEKDVSNYVDSKFTKQVFKAELNNADNIFHIIYYNKTPVGYSKIILNSSQENIQIKGITKLERLYILKEYHHLKLGLELLNFNLDLSQKNQQTGIWLYVWIENHKAINFYKKAGFKIIDKYNFKISETHSNPNHQMLLIYN